MKDKRILVTGGTGLVGSYMLRWLLYNGYSRLTATYQREHAIPVDLQKAVEWKAMRLPDRTVANDVVAEKDWVIHAAALIAYEGGKKRQLLDINFHGTEHIVNACLDHQVEHLIYLSSIGALGKEKDHISLDESTPWIENQFSTSYGLSKYLGELEVWRGAAEGLNVSVVLPSLVLGTGDWQRSSLQIIDRIAHGPAWYPTGQTGFIDVRDIARFMLMLLEKNITGERWLISAESRTYGELYKTTAKFLGINRSYRPAPRWLAGMMLGIMGLFSGKRLGREVLRHTYGTFNYLGDKCRTVDGFEYRELDKSLEEISSAYMDGKRNQVLAW